MSSTQDPLPSPIIPQWREANTRLTNAVSEYLRSCLALESLSDFPNSSDAQDLTLDIDQMINFVPKIVFEQLTQSCASLVRTRSRLVTSIYSLPAEILSEVFRLVIRSPSKVQPWKMGIRSLYHRVHTLVSVCSEWRRVGLARTDFWTLVPIIHDGSQDLEHVTGLSIHRSGNSSLHIVADLGLSIPKSIAIPPEHAARFRTLNIRSKSNQGIKDMISLWLEHGVPGSVTGLSICYAIDPPDYGFTFTTLCPPESDTQLLLSKFVARLSTLRISRTLIYLGNIYFDTLTELWIDHVGFSWSEGSAFLSALSSMPSLRALHIITVVLEPEPDTPEDRLSILLPSLQTLYLENLCTAFLQLIFASIAPGPYSIVIYVCGQTFVYDYRFLGDGSDHDDPGVKELLSILEGVNVSAVLVDTDPQYVIPPLLQALPTLRALYSSSLTFDEPTLRGLIRPPNSDNPFPILRELHVGHVMTESPESSDLFKDVVSNHTIENMTLGGDPHGSRAEDDASSSFKTLMPDDEIVTWLRSRVRNFRLIDHRDRLPEFEQHKPWELW